MKKKDILKLWKNIGDDEEIVYHEFTDCDDCGKLYEITGEFGLNKIYEKSSGKPSWLFGKFAKTRGYISEEAYLRNKKCEELVDLFPKDMNGWWCSVECGIVRVSFRVGMNNYKLWNIRFLDNGTVMVNNTDYLHKDEPFVSWEIFMKTAKQQAYNYMNAFKTECEEMMENLK